MKTLVITAIILLFSHLAIGQKVFIGQNFNDVGNELTLIVQDKMGMVEKLNKYNDSTIIIEYEPKFYTGVKRSLSLSYSMTEGTVNEVKVEGTTPEVVNLFSGYWKTKANYTNTKSIAIEKHFVTDVIRLKSGKPGEAVLTVNKG